MKRSVGAILVRGHHAVLHVGLRADAAHRAEGVLAAFPEQVALLGGARHAELARAAQHAGLPNLLHLLFHPPRAGPPVL